ncbi:nucleotidyltransferase-like protein [Bacillaceae bacterium S4-13-56]
MEDLLRPIYQERASASNTLGILLLEKNKPISPLTDNFDAILLVVVHDAEVPWFVKHYEFQSGIAALHIVDHEKLHEWIDNSSYRRAVEWIIHGDIIFDRNEYMVGLKKELQEFPQGDRDRKLMMEFGKLIRAYLECKDLFQSNQILDSYSRMIHSLHYLARLAVIEKGFRPEVTVWNQVKKMDPEIHKLYQELITSQEPPEKRIQLLLLATEVAINSRVKTAIRHLKQIMQEKDEPWTFGDLRLHPETQLYSKDLSAVVEYLVEKDILKVSLKETKGKDIFHRTYLVK